MEKFVKKLWEELEEIARKPEFGAGDLEIAQKLTCTIKDLEEICAGGYSSAGGYGRGASYANRGEHYVRGHYSRDGGMDRSMDSRDGYSSRRDSRGRYSRADGRSEMMEHLEKAWDSAPEQDREGIRRFMEKLERA